MSGTPGDESDDPRGTTAAGGAGRRVVAIVALTALGVVVATSMDGPAYRGLVDKAAENQGWARLLRLCGYWPVWGVVGAAMLMIDWGDRRPRWPRTDKWTRAVLLWVSSAAGGLVAELLKLIVRRERPELHDGVYAFRAITEHPFSTSGLGMPSSHTGVAFAAAWTLTRLHPQGAMLWMLLAVGCGVTRILDRAHYMSDVYAGAIIGIGIAELFWRAHVRNHRVEGIGP